MDKPPFAHLAFAAPRVTVETRDDGSLVLRSPEPLETPARHLGEWLLHWAEAKPDTLFLAERDGAGWREITYAEAGRRARAIAGALLRGGYGPDRPVMALSGNSVDQGLLMLGCFLAGVPFAPVSPAYSLLSEDHGKLRHIYELVRPGMVYVEQVAPFERALAAIDLDGVQLVARDPAHDTIAAGDLGGLETFDPGPALEAKLAELGPDTVAKYLFTSGSTGLPKGVINTHGMLCANQQMIAQVWPFIHDHPPVLLDWLPWNHTFGGNHDFNLVLRHGGTLYIDGGKPAPGLIEQTVANLREIAPTIYFNVPAGFAALLPFLEKDDELAAHFFSRLQMIFYAGAALSPDLWERLEALSIRHRGERVILTTAWGSTETSPGCTYAHWPMERAGVIGLPVPGVEIKLVPSGAKQELRIRGPHVTPGYLRRPDLTADAFDEEDFYRIGDAGRLADPEHPEAGIVFDGRVAEDFKLSSGTWVHAGAVRIAALSACSPLLQDAVVCGHDRDFVALLAWPNVAACKEVCPDPQANDDMAKLLACPEVVARIRAGLGAHNDEAEGTSARIARLMLMAEPPSVDANEITDKGYINQAAALDRRVALVERLYAARPDEEVIVA
jgi:feruloyl-CoA synthase